MNNLNYTVIDAETTTHNKGHPFDPRNKLISYAKTNRNSSPCFKYHTDPDFNTARAECQGNSVIVGFNFKFDCHWLFPEGLTNPIWDCQLAEHVYTGQKGQFISLDECLAKYGLETKKDIVKEYWEAGVDTDAIPIEILEEYNCWDVIQTEKLFLVQQELLSEEQKQLVYLMGEDLKCLAEIERNGLLFDVENAKKYLHECVLLVGELEAKLSAFLPTIVHGRFNWDSGDCLSCFLYGGTLDFDYFTETPSVYKSGEKKGQEYIKKNWFTETVAFDQRFKPLEGTETKKTKEQLGNITRIYQTDAPTLSSLKGNKENKSILDLLKKRSETQKLIEMLESVFKLFDTYGWEDNLVHGTYNQNVAVTGRLSSSKPNMQNFPPELDKFFISRYAD